MLIEDKVAAAREALQDALDLALDMCDDPKAHVAGVVVGKRYNGDEQRANPLAIRQRLAPIMASMAHAINEIDGLDLSLFEAVKPKKTAKKK